MVFCHQGGHVSGPLRGFRLEWSAPISGKRSYRFGFALSLCLIDWLHEFSWRDALPIREGVFSKGSF